MSVNEQRTTTKRKKKRGEASSQKHRDAYLEKIGLEFERQRRNAILARCGEFSDEDIPIPVSIDRAEAKALIPPLEPPGSWQCDRYTTCITPSALGLPDDTHLVEGDVVTVHAIASSNVHGLYVLNTTDEGQIGDDDASDTMDVVSEPSRPPAARQAAENKRTGKKIVSSHPGVEIEPSEPNRSSVADPAKRKRRVNDSVELRFTKVAVRCSLTIAGMTEPSSSYRTNGCTFLRDTTLSGTKGTFRAGRIASTCFDTCPSTVCCYSCHGVSYPVVGHSACGPLALMLNVAGGKHFYRVVKHERLKSGSATICAEVLDTGQST